MRISLCVVLGLLLSACAGAKVNDKPATGSGGSGGTTTTGFILPDGGTVGPSVVLDPAEEACPDPKACTDFPEGPTFEKGAPTDAASKFGDPGSGSPPCVLEPEDGAMYPYNWLRPRFRWSGSTGLTRITITNPRQKNPYVIFTLADSWTMPKDVWKKLAAHIRDEDITVEVRPLAHAPSTIKFKVAPTGASGSIVFWAADPSTVGKTPEKAVDGDSMLKGFSVGEEGTVDALLLSQVKQPSRWQSYAERKPKCMGCHVATPDPGFVAFVDHWPWNTVIAGIKSSNVGDSLPNMTPGGLSALNKPWSGMPTFSKAFWGAGNRLMVTTSAQTSDAAPWSTDNNKIAKLVWFNLDSALPLQQTANAYLAEFSKNYGVIARNGDAGGVAFPTWSPDGSTIVYCSTNAGNLDGRLEKGATNLYSVPFNGGSGGDAKPVAGAAEAAWEEYYPVFSPDGKYILYDRVPAGERMYANPKAEMYAVPAQGGTAVRLASNSPPECAKKPSPGINNHFPRWSPVVKSDGEKNYYWFIFSSNRMGLPQVKYKREYDGGEGVAEISQLYLSLIVEQAGKLTTYPAIYLWNQSTAMVNTTPVWDVLEIPPVVIF